VLEYNTIVEPLQSTRRGETHFLMGQ